MIAVILSDIVTIVKAQLYGWIRSHSGSIKVFIGTCLPKAVL